MDICWDAMTPEEKKLQLFLNQKALLEQFLANGAISEAQYRKSYTDLKGKMGITDELPES